MKLFGAAPDLGESSLIWALVCLKWSGVVPSLVANNRYKFWYKIYSAFVLVVLAYHLAWTLAYIRRISSMNTEAGLLIVCLGWYWQATVYACHNSMIMSKYGTAQYIIDFAR